jgi:hypothetical protein
MGDTDNEATIMTLPVNTRYVFLISLYGLFVLFTDVIACVHVIRSASAHVMFISVVKLTRKLLNNLTN